tara:strand:+ start:989 stop:1303 length:315 start_codon:yes stop_codon:yes gene_type:complete
MEFCPKCGAIIEVAENKASCTSCSYKLKKKPRIEASEKVQKHETVAVINEEEDNTYPTVEIKCPKCSNKKAFFWTQQTRAADESETKFYKCADSKCHHTWRVYT